MTAAGKRRTSTSFRLVDPCLNEACCRYIAVLFTYVVRLSEAAREILVVVTQLGQHVHRFDIVRIIIQDSLQASDMIDRPQSHRTHLANSLSDRIGHPEQLTGLLIHHQMVVAKMRAADMPMEVLGF
jgi:hypothetical protein